MSRSPYLSHPRGTAPALPLDLSALSLAEASALTQIAGAAKAKLVIRWNNERDDKDPRADKTARLIHIADKLYDAALRQERVAARAEAAAARREAEAA